MLGWSISVSPVDNSDQVVAYWMAGLGGLSWLNDKDLTSNGSGYPDIYVVPMARVRTMVESSTIPSLEASFKGDPKTNKPPLYDVVRNCDLYRLTPDSAMVRVEVWDQS